MPTDPGGAQRARTTVAKHELQGTGTAVNTIACHLVESDNVAGMLTSALSLCGRIGIVVNNAGRIDVGPIDSLLEKDFHAETRWSRAVSARLSGTSAVSSWVCCLWLHCVQETPFNGATRGQL